MQATCATFPSERTDVNTAARRAGGWRGTYNRRRTYERNRRLVMLLTYFIGRGGQPWRCGEKMADALGVSRSTICRDLAAIFGPWTGPPPRVGGLRKQQPGATAPTGECNE